MIFKLVNGTSFTFVKIVRALVDIHLLLMMKMVAESNTQSPNFVTSSQDYHSEFVISGIDLKNS